MLRLLYPGETISGTRRRLSGPQCRSGRFGDVINFVPRPRIEKELLRCQPLVYSLRQLRHLSSDIHRVSQEECARLREGVPYVTVYRYNPKHLCPKLNGYGDNGQRKVWSSCGSTYYTCQLTTLSMSVLECGVILRQFSSCSQ